MLTSVTQDRQHHTAGDNTGQQPQAEDPNASHARTLDRRSGRPLDAQTKWPGLRPLEGVDAGLHGGGVAREGSAGDEIEGFLAAEAGAGVRGSADGIAAGHQ